MGKNSTEFKKNEHTQIVRIGKAAAKLYNEKGYTETSIADIASAVRMSIGRKSHLL